MLDRVQVDRQARDGGREVSRDHHPSGTEFQACVPGTGEGTCAGAESLGKPVSSRLGIGSSRSLVGDRPSVLRPRSGTELIDHARLVAWRAAADPPRFERLLSPSP